MKTAELLKSSGYEFSEVARLPPERPEISDVAFEEVHPGFSGTRLAGRRLYRHQLEALEALKDGLNVVLVSGTGSGKTEAWVSWVAWSLARGSRVKALAVYPTLALSWDQVERLREYSRALGFGVVAVDSLAKREEAGLRSRVRDAAVIATNPSMMLYELKKHLVKPGSSVLSPAFEALDLLVVDELDFYDPRSLALLLGMIELLAALRRGLMRVAVLSATIANPEDLAGYLERVTGRRTAVIRGRRFSAETRVIVVLGKNLEGVRRALASEAERRGLSLPQEIAEALSDPKRFAEKAYLVVDYFRAVGVEPPSIAPDPSEIIEWFARDAAEPRGLTLVFTRSINDAERLARSLRERLGSESRRVAAHHHLVPKEERRAIEEAARRGEVRVIVTPRTLTQGIDIGSVVRVVHVGLPVDVREFWQREGRKGRREGVEYTESIIIPRGRWDHELMRRGVSALREWLGLGLERVYVNPENHYKALLTGAAKLISGLLRAAGAAELDEREAEALKAAKVLRGDGRVDEGALVRLWEMLNFYEYGPPYGVKRVLESDGRQRELEEVGRCDLVERFQPGCFDPAHDAVVVKLLHSPRSSRYVYRIVEAPVRDVYSAREPEWFMEAVEEYRSVKERWGEEARFLSDFARGLVESTVETIVYPPRRGFGLLRKIPHRTVWTVTSSRLKAQVGRDGRVRVYRPRAYVPVESRVAGEYRDYTYGFMVEAPQGYPAEMLRLGLATLGVYLRRELGVPLGLIKYSVYAVGERRLIEVHEESAAGLIERIDWASIASRVRSWRPGDIDEILLLALDEYAYSTLEGLGFDWERALEAAAVAARTLASIQSVEVRLSGSRIRVPRPSRALRMGAVAALAQDVEVESVALPMRVVAVAYFDGEEVRAASDLVLAVSGGRPREPLASIEHAVLMDVSYEGFTLYAFNPGAEARDLKRAGLKLLAQAVRGAVSVRELAGKAGLDIHDPSLLARAMEVEGLEVEEPKLERVFEVLSRPLPSARLSDWQRRELEAYVAGYAKLVYLAALALRGVGSAGAAREAGVPG